MYILTRLCSIGWIEICLLSSTIHTDNWISFPLPFNVLLGLHFFFHAWNTRMESGYPENYLCYSFKRYQYRPISSCRSNFLIDVEIVIAFSSAGCCFLSFPLGVRLIACFSSNVRLFKNPTSHGNAVNELTWIYRYIHPVSPDFYVTRHPNY